MTEPLASPSPRENSCGGAPCHREVGSLRQDRIPSSTEPPSYPGVSGKNSSAKWGGWGQVLPEGRIGVVRASSEEVTQGGGRRDVRLHRQSFMLLGYIPAFQTPQPEAE